MKLLRSLFEYYSTQMPPNNKRTNRANRKELAKTLDNDLPELDKWHQYAKVFKAEGDGKFIVLLNNGRMAVTSVCGKLWKRVWIVKNDIVVVSLRDEMAPTIHKTYGKMIKGDICGKIPENLYGKLKKIEGFNLLKTLNENLDGSVTLGNTKASGGGCGKEDSDDEGFEFVYDGEEDEEGDEDEEDDDAASFDSYKKEKSKRAGQARKELTEEDIKDI